MEEPKWNVFLSHANADQEFAQRLARALVDRGYRVYPGKRLEPGSDWLIMLQSMLEASQAVVTVVSPASVVDEMVREALDHARALGMRIIPVLYRDLGKMEMPAELADRQWVDIRDENDFGRGVEELAYGLSGAPDGRPLPGDVVKQDADLAASTATTTLSVVRENGTPTPLDGDPELQRVLLRATHFSPRTENRFDLSFTSLLLATLDASPTSSASTTSCGRYGGRVSCRSPPSARWCAGPPFRCAGRRWCAGCVAAGWVSGTPPRLARKR